MSSSLIVWIAFYLILSSSYFDNHSLLQFLPSSILPFWRIILITGIFICFLFIRKISFFLIFQFLKVKKFIPKISKTEKEALEAGDTWIEKDFFTGHLNFKKLLNQKIPQLHKREIDFLNQEVEELCGISKEWDLIQRKKLKQETEDFLKTKKFFGLIIPEKYHGKNFSALAHAKIIEKIASHNIPLAIITMVPNSLGPAELLKKYGSLEQKNKYLPRLALGEEIPCFGLTEASAGSDASSIQSEAILFKKDNRLKLRLNFEKQWITLGSKATLIGLAVQLKDPDKLYSDKINLGITCLLISGNTPGIQNTLHHDPMGIPIYNAPLIGTNVIVDAEESCLGGLKMAGLGWSMLMDVLSTGRGISLPSLSIACGKRISYLVSLQALVRKQFGVPIGHFEGVAEALAPIAGLTHLMEVTQKLTLSGLDQNFHSPVLAAITKYHLTEFAQQITKNGMDIMGGRGLSLGPRNKIASIYNSLPMAITVEGANILTRTLIVYGQGIIKSHPYLYKIIEALEKNQFKKFQYFFSKFTYDLISLFVKSFLLSLTSAWLYISPRFFGKNHRALQKLALSSALFAFLTNLNLLTFGGKLKSKGRITGRFSDLLSYQYMALALLWNAQQEEKKALKNTWALEYCFFKIQEALEGILREYPKPFVRFGLKIFLFLLRLNPIGHAPSDKLSQSLAKKFLEDEEFRKTLCSNMYLPKDPEDIFQKLERAYKIAQQEEEILKKISRKKNHWISKEEAYKQKIISSEEYEILILAEKTRLEACQVDSFTEEEYFHLSYKNL